jgi:hypothetical protein
MSEIRLSFLRRHWGRVTLSLIFLFILAWALAWISSGFSDVAGWGSFFAVLLLGAGILFGVWQTSQSPASPGWLAGLLVGAALLRLGIGVFWYLALPEWGYETEVQRAGYVMEDAFRRDRTAWELAVSDEPLWRAFSGYRQADQYGGLLFLSAGVYRYLGGSEHRPLLMVVLAAATSAAGVLLAWGFAWRVWGPRVARCAAWGLALYPEAVLLGSSQMREAFTVTLAAGAFFGLAGYLQGRRWGLYWLGGTLALGLLLSPPFTGLLIGALAVAALWLGGRRMLHHGWVWALLLVLTVLVMTGVWLGWRQLAPEGVSNPLALIGWWFKRTWIWQAYLTERASGWLQKIFDSSPEWLRLPLLLGYGIVQPFLPAALVADGAPLWRGVAIWRALGWTLLLPLLLYAPFKAWREGGRRSWERALSLIVWGVIVLAALRGGGDQWDNPRYRAAFAGLQLALGGWVLVSSRKATDPWLRRAVVGLGLVLLWFLPWYLRRYTAFRWPVVDLFKTLGLGLVTAVLYLIWDWLGSQKEP